MTQARPKIVIVGGGIGGLFAANALVAQGLRVSVYEQAPALREVNQLLSLLNSKEKELKATLSAVGPYASILGNVIGTGPWFDAYVFNLATIPTGEFQPGLLGEGE